MADWRYPCMAVVLCLLSPVASSVAQSSASDLALAPVYTDRSYGFSVRPPEGCTAYREKQFAGQSEIELVRFVNKAKDWALIVRVLRTTRVLDEAMIGDEIRLRLMGIPTLSDLEILKSEPVRVSGRKGLQFAARFNNEGNPVFRQQLVVETQPKEYLSLIFVAPAKDVDTLEKLFEAVAASFEVQRTQALQEQLTKALDDGRALLAQLKSDGIDPEKMARDPQFLKFIQDGKEIGFVRIDERPAKLRGEVGLEFLKNVWLFTEDGRTTHLLQRTFLSKDLAYEEWATELRIVTPSKDKTSTLPDQVLIDLENGIVEGDMLLLRYTSQDEAEGVKDRRIEIGSTYVATTWDLIFPRLKGLEQEKVYGFTMYDPARRGLHVRTMRVLGERSIRQGSQVVKGKRIEDSEGLLPPWTAIDVDDKGRIVRVTSAGTVMEQVTELYAMKKFGTRVERTKEMIERLAKQKTGPLRR